MSMENQSGLFMDFLLNKEEDMGYVELQVTTNFSFLKGGSHPKELIEQAAALGYKEIAITDENTLAGIVRAHVAAKKTGIRMIPGCRLVLLDGPSLLAYPTDKAAYSRLSGLLSEGNLRTEKGKCDLYKADVYRYATGIKFIVIPPTTLNARFEFAADFCEALKEYKERLGKDVYLGATRSYQANDGKKLFRLAQLSQQLDMPLVATNDVHYHERGRRELQDILTCVREKCTIYNAGYRLYQNAERYLKPEQEMLRLFEQYPDAIARTQEIADMCQFSLSSLKYVYPEELTNEGRTPQQELNYLTWQGAKEKFPNGVPKGIKKTIVFELQFMKRKNYASYFLTVHDFVHFAKKEKILCQGRGSAANSIVCYCLGITSVDPIDGHPLFARFMSDERDEPPDIDVDFEHERREEVIQYIYKKYGRDRAAIVATVTQVHFKGAVRDVAKAMGMSTDAVNRLSKSSWEFTDEWAQGGNASIDGFDAKDPHLMKILQLTQQYIGFPRQLGQHTGGFVITQGKLADLCPILNARMENRICIEWNKDDIEALGFLKVDVLALGMLTCIRKAFDLAKQHHNKDFTLAGVGNKEKTEEREKVYDMICQADTIGVFQIESRAQMSMLPRLKPRKFYDLVIEVAIVRPGPIQGDMVHPYLLRRDDPSKVIYPSPELKAILKRTLGVPLFQEQAMEIAIVAAGFTPSEADQLRRSMATFKAKGEVSQFRQKMIDGMKENGYDEQFAERVFKQLEGFGSYGFPESHAASFALLVFVSSYIKCYFPDVFATAILNSMPMGFYQPAQIIIDAQNHDVQVRPVDINYSCWDNTLEEPVGKYCAMRLGFRQVQGLNEDDMQLLVNERRGGFNNILALLHAGIPLMALEKLADADAFRSLGMGRRQALWEISSLGDSPTGIFTGQTPETAAETGVQLPLMSEPEHVLQDYAVMGLSLKAHPVSFVREKLALLGITPNAALSGMQNGDIVKIAGLVLIRQRPGTATGICFITTEDETGIANSVVFRKIFDRDRGQIVRARLLMITGKLQIESNVIHVVAQKCEDISGLMRDLTVLKEEGAQVRAPIQPEIFHGGRNFK